MQRIASWSIFALASAVGLTACGTDERDDSAITAGNNNAAALRAVCVTSDEVPEGVWRCGETRRLECRDPDGTRVDAIYVVERDAPREQCDDAHYTLSHEGPFPAGEQVIVVSRDGDEVCRSRLIIEDTRPPVAELREISLWPPNHKLHTITPADCVTVRDRCEGTLVAHFTFATVDESADINGAGRRGEDDIVGLGCDRVQLRAERAGGGDGRVYTLGWRAQDSAGHHIRGVCRVVVPHDQGGGNGPTIGPDAHRVEVPTDCHENE